MENSGVNHLHQQPGAQNEPFFDLLQQSSGPMSAPPASTATSSLPTAVYQQPKKVDNSAETYFRNDDVLPSFDFQPIRPTPGSSSSVGGSTSSVSRAEEGRGRQGSPPKSYSTYEPMRSREPPPTFETPVTRSLELEKESIDAATAAAVEKTMKKYADNLLRALEGLTGRLSHLESSAQRLERLVEEGKAAAGDSHLEVDGKLRSLESHLLEIQRSVQLLRDRQEIHEAQSQLAKLQTASKGETTASHQNVPSAPLPPPSPAPESPSHLSRASSGKTHLESSHQQPTAETPSSYYQLQAPHLPHLPQLQLPAAALPQPQLLPPTQPQAPLPTPPHLPSQQLVQQQAHLQQQQQPSHHLPQQQQQQQQHQQLPMPQQQQPAPQVQLQQQMQQPVQLQPSSIQPEAPHQQQAPPPPHPSHLSRPAHPPSSSGQQQSQQKPAPPPPGQPMPPYGQPQQAPQQPPPPPNYGSQMPEQLPPYGAQLPGSQHMPVPPSSYPPELAGYHAAYGPPRPGLPPPPQQATQVPPGQQSLNLGMYESSLGRSGSAHMSGPVPPYLPPGHTGAAHYEAQGMSPSSGYSGSSYRVVQPLPSAPSGGGGGYPRLPMAQPVQQSRPSSGGGSGPSSSSNASSPANRVPIDEVIEKVTAMGFSKDQVRAVVRRLTENGQSVDLNVVLDKLMNGDSSAQSPQKGWFGR